MRSWWIWCSIGLVSLFWIGCTHSTIQGSSVVISAHRAQQYRDLSSIAHKLSKNYHVSVVENSDNVVVMLPTGQLFVGKNNLLFKNGSEQLVQDLVQLLKCYPEYVVRVGGCCGQLSCAKQALMLERARMLEALLAVYGMQNLSGKGWLDLCSTDTVSDGFLLLILKRASNADK